MDTSCIPETPRKTETLTKVAEATTLNINYPLQQKTKDDGGRGSGMGGDQEKHCKQG